MTSKQLKNIILLQTKSSGKGRAHIVMNGYLMLDYKIRGGVKMDLKKIITEIENHKKQIAKHRNALRDIMDDLETDLESFDYGIDCLEDGIEEIKQAIDSISEVV
jgi:archaellum component FlaC